MTEILSVPPGEVTLRRLLAPLREALDHPDTREVVVNRPGEFGREDGEGWHWSEAPALTFRHLDALARLAGRMTGQDLSNRTPTCSSRLPDGERITVAMPPAMAPGTISLTIRKRALSFTPTLDWLEDKGWFRFLPPGRKWRRWLEDQVLARRTIVFTGETGSSKTTAAEACILAIPDEERVITLESVPEWHLSRRNWVPIIYAQKPGQGLPLAEEALELALRQRPDRILFGEMRTGEAWAYLRALQAGHRGGISTLHAEGGIEAFLAAILLMIRQSPHAAAVGDDKVEELVRRTVDIVIHCERVRGDNEGVPYRAARVDELRP